MSWLKKFLSLWTIKNFTDYVREYKFMTADKNWKTTMLSVFENPKVIASVDNGTMLLKLFQNSNHLLERFKNHWKITLKLKEGLSRDFIFIRR